VTNSAHHRRERVAMAIKQNLADALTKRVKDPRVELTSISRVEVTSDLSHATILVSVLGGDEERAAALAGLESARGFLRSLLAKTLSLRNVPELHFAYDRGLDHAARMFEIFDQMKKEEDSN